MALDSFRSTCSSVSLMVARWPVMEVQSCHYPFDERADLPIAVCTKIRIFEYGPNLWGIPSYR